MLRHILVFSLIALLAGCAGLTSREALEGQGDPAQWRAHKQQITQLDGWQINGKIGIRAPQDSGSATLFWLQRQDYYDIRLSGPLGGGGGEVADVGQGVAAEELVHLVSNVGCRALWDERMGAASIVAAYGSGAHTACWTSHGTFPFRPRLFVVGSVTACGRHAAPVSPSGLLSPTSARQPVYFHASASCDADTVDVAALNPQQLPVGRVLIDGWILETLDPYSSAHYPIPSTRATHVVAIDYGGAMPTAVNALWNAALPRALGPLAHFLQTHGPPPFVHVPPAWMEVGGDGHDDDRTLVWTLQRPARRVNLLARDFGAQSRTLDVRVQLPPQDVRRAAGALAAPPPWSSCRTSPSWAGPWAWRRARPSSPPKGIASSASTIARSSCGSWPMWPTFRR